MEGYLISTVILQCHQSCWSLKDTFKIVHINNKTYWITLDELLNVRDIGKNEAMMAH
jgi:hypothetical protein